MQLNVELNKVWCNESPVKMVEGAAETFSIKVLSGGALSSSSAACTFKRRTDITATVFPTGTVTQAGNIVTLKPMTALVGGNNYVVTVATTESGNTKKYKFMVKVEKPSQEQ